MHRRELCRVKRDHLTAIPTLGSYEIHNFAAVSALYIG